MEVIIPQTVECLNFTGLTLYYPSHSQLFMDFIIFKPEIHRFLTVFLFHCNNLAIYIFRISLKSLQKMQGSFKFGSINHHQESRNLPQKVKYMIFIYDY